MTDFREPTGRWADDPEFRTEPIWTLPTDRDMFRAWLRKADLSLAEFMELPIAVLMPDQLRRDLTEGPYEV